MIMMMMMMIHDDDDGDDDDDHDDHDTHGYLSSKLFLFLKSNGEMGQIITLHKANETDAKGSNSWPSGKMIGTFRKLLF